MSLINTINSIFFITLVFCSIFLKAIPSFGSNFISQNKNLELILKNEFQNSDDLNASKLLSWLQKNKYYESKVDYNEQSDSYFISNAYIVNWVFSGNEFLTRAELHSKIETFLEEKSQKADTFQIMTMLKSFYKTQGFDEINISPYLKTQTYTWKKIIHLKISENTRFRISELSLNDQSTPEKPVITKKDFLKLAEMSLRSKVYVFSDLEKSAKNYNRYLKNKGYFQSELKDILVHNDGPYLKKLEFIFSSNPMTQLKELEVKSDNPSLDVYFHEKLSPLVNEAFNLNKFTHLINKTEDHFKKEGYLQFKYLNKNNSWVSLTDENATQAKLTLSVRYGKKVFVDSISYPPELKTHKRVIDRSLNFKEGDLLTPKKIKKTTQRLNSLGIFSRVQIIPKEKENGKFDIHLKLQERKSGWFDIHLGASNERDLTVRTGFGVGFRNLGRKARGLTLRTELKSSVLDVKYPEHKVSLTYYAPFLLGTKNKGRFRLERKVDVWNVNESVSPRLVTINSSNRVDFLIDRDLSDHLKLTWTLFSLDIVTENEKDNLFPRFQERIATMGPTLDYDIRDKPFLPTKGSYIRWNLEYSDGWFGSQINSSGQKHDLSFLRSQLFLHHYKSLSPNKLIWAQAARVGYLKNLSQNSDLFPKSRAFFLGGSSTIRGFDPSIASERILPDSELLTQGGPLNSGGQLLIPDSSAYFLYKSELRFHLVKSFWGAVFYDGGGVDQSTISESDIYRHSAGFGVHFKTPVGSINFELGFKLDKKPGNESAARFHFNLGSF